MIPLPPADQERAADIRDTVLNAIKIEVLTDPTDALTVLEALAAVSGEIIKACPPEFKNRTAWQDTVSFYFAKRVGMYHEAYINGGSPFPP